VDDCGKKTCVVAGQKRRSATTQSEIHLQIPPRILAAFSLGMTNVAHSWATGRDARRPDRKAKAAELREAKLCATQRQSRAGLKADRTKEKARRDSESRDGRSKQRPYEGKSTRQYGGGGDSACGGCQREGPRYQPAKSLTSVRARQARTGRELQQRTQARACATSIRLAWDKNWAICPTYMRVRVGRSRRQRRFLRR
jgi:hypothetical protein